LLVTAWGGKLGSQNSANQRIMGMFKKRSDPGCHPALKGVERKTPVRAKQALMTEFRLGKGSELPRHTHPHEQTDYRVRERLCLFIGNEEGDAQRGDS